jgi:hypothetical protein
VGSVAAGAAGSAAGAAGSAAGAAGSTAGVLAQAAQESAIMATRINAMSFFMVYCFLLKNLGRFQAPLYSRHSYPRQAYKATKAAFQQRDIRFVKG